MNKIIIWNIVNSLLAGVLVLLGACTVGRITWDSFVIAFVVGAIVAFNQFKDFWETQMPRKIGAFL